MPWGWMPMPGPVRAKDMAGTEGRPKRDRRKARRRKSGR